MAYPPVLYLSTALLVARVTQSLSRSQSDALHALAALEDANTRLAAERQRAEHANQAKSTFFTSMSHEPARRSTRSSATRSSSWTPRRISTSRTSSASNAPGRACSRW